MKSYATMYHMTCLTNEVMLLIKKKSLYFMEGMQVLVNWDSHKSYRDENGLIEDIITFVYSMLCMIPTVDKYFFIIPYVAFRGM